MRVISCQEVAVGSSSFGFTVYAGKKSAKKDSFFYPYNDSYKSKSCADVKRGQK